MLPQEVDVAIVGCGTAGAALAAFCAERGLSVLALDRSPLDAAGARWVNGVRGADFDAAGVARPTGEERLGGQDRFHLVAGWGPQRITVRGHDVLDVDMRRLVARLQARAEKAGATLVGGVAVRGREGRRLHTEDGEVEARFLVDASGLTGARLLGQPAVPARHLCAAAQGVYELASPSAAEGFLDAQRVEPGEALCFTGVAGGYSIVNVRVSQDHVSLLTGSIPAGGHASGRALLERFVARHSWVGRPIFGGARAIPIRRPRDTLAVGPVALLGDAACQVFPAHGSGIGAGMVAARGLADALSAGRSPDDWAVAWQREHGGRFAAYDLFRRFSESLSQADLEGLMAEGLMDAVTARAGLEQSFPPLPPSALPGRLRALARSPRLASRLGAVGARMGAVVAAYAAYPRRSEGRLRWARAVARLFDEAPDPTLA